jgi:hypothetical protein
MGRRRSPPRGPPVRLCFVFMSHPRTTCVCRALRSALQPNVATAHRAERHAHALAFLAHLSLGRVARMTGATTTGGDHHRLAEEALPEAAVIVASPADHRRVGHRRRRADGRGLPLKATSAMAKRPRGERGHGHLATRSERRKKRRRRARRAKSTTVRKKTAMLVTQAATTTTKAKARPRMTSRARQQMATPRATARTMRPTCQI